LDYLSEISSFALPVWDSTAPFCCLLALKMALRFSNLLLLLRDVPSAAKFYGPDGLGLKIVGQASSWAVLETEGLRISLQQTEGYFENL